MTLEALKRVRVEKKLDHSREKCRDPGSNRGPLDLQSNALPTELSRLVIVGNQIANRPSLTVT